MVSNIKNLTSGVGDLVKKVDQLYSSLNKVNTVATKVSSNLSSVVSTSGGQYGLTQGSTRPGTGADGAHFATPAGPVGRGQNFMQNSLGVFSMFGSGYGYGGGRFQYPGYPQMPMGGGMGGGMGGRAAGVANMGMAAVSFGLGVAGGAYTAMPGVNETLTRTYGYYQAGLRSPGINRNQLERATFSGLKGGISEVGSDAQVAATLAAMGYTPGSANYMQAVGQVGGAYKYLGMGNAQATQAIAGFQTGPMAANLFQYGITTTTAGGKEKTTGQIARELMNYMTGGAQVSAEDVRRSYQKGALGANLSTMGFSQDQQNMLYQAMIDLASGRNPDLQNAAPASGNANTFLTAQGRLNASTTNVMMAAEEKMIKGFENAADTVEAFNRALLNVVEPLGYLKGYLGGVGGTDVGKGAGKVLKTIAGGALALGGVALAPFSMGAGLAVSSAGLALMGSGGGTTGFGSSFGVANKGRTGGSSPVGGAPVTAGYGATDTTAGSPWANTGGVHKGMDYAVPIGTPVTSAFDGVVSAVNLNADYGTSVMVDNINGTQAIYGHLSEKTVNVGDPVKQGQRIGKSGKSGNANGPHLHFEIRNGKNNPVDPRTYTSGAAAYLFKNYATTLPTGYEIVGSSPSSSGGQLSGQMGTEDQQKWAKDFLSRIGAPTSDANVTALNTWMRAEGRGWSTSLNRATFNPLNTTLDMPGAVSFNKVGVKAYTSYEQGMDATIATLSGKSADERGYTAILNALKSDSGVSAVLGAVNNSAWRTGQTGGAGAYSSFGSRGGATTGYGAAIPSPTISSGNKTVNITLKIERASDQEALIFAKKVKQYLETENEVSTIGRS